MKKVLFLIVLLCAIVSCSCADRPPELSSTESYRLQTVYRNSACVVKASCVGVSDEDGYSIMNINETVAGDLSGTIYLSDEKISAGNDYILFLDSISGNMHYDALSCTVMQIRGDSVSWDGARYSKKSVYEFLSECKETLSFPFATYFYETRSDLIKGSNDIIVGKLTAEPVIEERNTYTQASAVSRKKMMKCNIASVHVISSLCGSLKSGDDIEVVYSPESISSMTNSSTLSTVSLAVKDIANLERSNYYIFFLNRTEDVKQHVYFPVNPIQGWIGLSRDNIISAEKNVLFDDCKQIKKLVSELNLNTVQGSTHNTKTDSIGE